MGEQSFDVRYDRMDNNKAAPGLTRCDNTDAEGLTATEERLMSNSMPSPCDDSTGEHRARLFEAQPTPSVIDRHWFVPDNDDGTFCLACNLPRYNVRHVARPGAAA